MPPGRGPGRPAGGSAGRRARASRTRSTSPPAKSPCVDERHGEPQAGSVRRHGGTDDSAPHNEEVEAARGELLDGSSAPPPSFPPLHTPTRRAHADLVPPISAEWCRDRDAVEARALARDTDLRVFERDDCLWARIPASAERPLYPSGSGLPRSTSSRRQDGYVGSSPAPESTGSISRGPRRRRRRPGRAPPHRRPQLVRRRSLSALCDARYRSMRSSTSAASSSPSTLSHLPMITSMESPASSP